MTRNEDLNKLFEEAFEGRKASGRFGIPEGQRKFSPIPVQSNESAPLQERRFQEVPAPVSEELSPPPPQAFPPAPSPNSTTKKDYHAVPAPVPSTYQRPPAPPQNPAPDPPSQSPFAKAFEPTPIPQVAQPIPQVAQPIQQPVALVVQPSQQPVDFKPFSPSQPESPGNQATLDERSQASLDAGLNEELGAILDAKIARGKRMRRRSLIVALIIVLALIGGATAWVVTNPERFEAMKKVAAEIKSVDDIKGMIKSYKEALNEKAAEGNQHIESATKQMQGEKIDF